MNKLLILLLFPLFCKAQTLQFINSSDNEVNIELYKNEVLIENIQLAPGFETEKIQLDLFMKYKIITTKDDNCKWKQSLKYYTPVDFNSQTVKYLSDCKFVLKA